MLPRVVLHNAVSLDGRLDWFPADIGLYYELAGHWQAGAILAGSETLLAAAEEPSSASEEALAPPEPDPDDSRPLLVVPDSRGRVRNWHYWRSQPYWRDVVVLCSRATPPDYLERLRSLRIDSIVTGEDHVDLREALETLAARYGVEQVRVDSGGTLNGVLLRAGLVDEVSVLVHPSLVGGTSPSSLFRAPDLSAPEGVIRLRLVHVERLRDDLVWLRYEVAR